MNTTQASTASRPASALNWNSRQITRGWQRDATAFFYGLGMTDDDFDRPQIGIGVPLLEGNVCNVHAYSLAQSIQQGCREAGLIGFPFGVPGVSDNITQGHEGGNASLPSRNMIANAAECVTSAHCYDGLIGLHNCDKNGPGFAMALARTNFPGLIVSGGSIQPGCHRGRNVTILDVYDSQAAAAMGTMSQDEADAILRTACPGPGGCGIAASFNTWGIAMEAIGLMLPASSSIPAVGPGKTEEARQVGQAMRRLLTEGIRPRDILTRRAFENATATIAAMGGSTNGILHLLALAREAGVPFTLHDMQQIFRKTPVVCSFAPRGSQTMVDLHHIGGTPVLLKSLIDQGIIDGSCLTVTGESLRENVAHAPAPPANQELIAPVGQPFKAFADIQVCFGNLALEELYSRCRACKNRRSAARHYVLTTRSVAEAAQQRRIRPGHVIVLRYVGPVAAGMPEVLIASAALAVPELDGKVALISDTRVSGVSHGAIGVHCVPEAAVGGPIAAVRDGDEISFDLLKGDCHLHLSESELAERRAAWSAPQIQHHRGYLADFAATVTQADQGCTSKYLAPAS